MVVGSSQLSDPSLKVREENYHLFVIPGKKNHEVWSLGKEQQGSEGTYKSLSSFLIGGFHSPLGVIIPMILLFLTYYSDEHQTQSFTSYFVAIYYFFTILEFCTDDKLFQESKFVHIMTSCTYHDLSFEYLTWKRKLATECDFWM